MSAELFRKWTACYDQLDNPPSFREDMRLSAELENGSWCISLPGSEAKVRGFSAPSLVIEDESARVGDDYHYSIKPMLAVSGGDLLLMSTPFGKRGHFFHIFTESGPEAKDRGSRYRMPQDLCRVLERRAQFEADAWFMAEYMCQFTETVDSVFTFERVMGAVSHGVEPLDFGGEV